MTGLGMSMSGSIQVQTDDAAHGKAEDECGVCFS